MGLESRILTPQAFSSNALNRSTLERRDTTFLEQALPQAQILLVSGRVGSCYRYSIVVMPCESCMVRSRSTLEFRTCLRGTDAQ